MEKDRAIHAITSTEPYVEVVDFTGNTDTDRLIFLQLPYDSIVAFCRAIPDISLCYNNNFWREKYSRDFTNDLPLVKSYKDEYFNNVALLNNVEYERFPVNKVILAAKKGWNPIAKNLLMSNQWKMEDIFNVLEFGTLSSCNTELVRWIFEKQLVTMEDINREGLMLLTPSRRRIVCYDMVKLLVHLGVNIHADEERALYSAVHNSKTDIVKLLLEAGSHVIDYIFEEAILSDNDDIMNMIRHYR